MTVLGEIHIWTLIFSCTDINKVTNS